MLEVDPEFWGGLIAIVTYVFFLPHVRHWDRRFDDGLIRMG